MNEKKPIRVGIIGVGNCAAALVQGTFYYSSVEREKWYPGLANPFVGPYEPSDVRFVSAFDVNSNKIGKDLSEAIFVDPNNTLKFCEVPHLGCTVHASPRLDGIGGQYQDRISVTECSKAEVLEELRRSKVEVLVNYLPVGSSAATEWWAECALEAGCAFVNCIPVFIASREEWSDRFKKAGLPLFGDDIKSQVGATILNRVLCESFTSRGAKIEHMYQLNFGGNMDFLNMLSGARLDSKRASKRGAVTSSLPHPIKEANLHVSPSDYVPWLTDQKVAYIRIEALGFGGTPMSFEARLQVWDSPNSAGVVIDAVRCARLAVERGLSGAIGGPSAYLFKTPPKQYSDAEALKMMQAFSSEGNDLK